MEIVNVKIDKLRPAEYNPRRWSKTIIKNLSRSIEKFGIVDPIIVNSAEKLNSVG